MALKLSHGGREAAPTPFPIIFFSKIATEKHREKRIIKDIKLVLGWQRTGFIFEMGRKETSQFLKRFRILICFFMGRTVFLD